MRYKLHQLKQAIDEQISIFAGRNRRYEHGLGLKKLKSDCACIDSLKIENLPYIQTRLYQRDQKPFTRQLRYL